MHIPSLGGGGGAPYRGLNGEAPPKRRAFFKVAVQRIGKIAILVHRSQISCKVKKMLAKGKHIKGCHILAEMTTQLNQND